MENSKQTDYYIEPGQQWEVDVFRPDDAEGVVGLFLSVYGKDYPIRTYVDRDILIRENAAGRVISSVARTPKGDIVGHGAVYCSSPYENIREAGAGLVHASYRGGSGMFARVAAHCIETGSTRFGVEAVYGECVCNHVFSQRMCRGLGMISHALEVDLMPASAYLKEKSASGRVASVFDLMTLHPKPHRVYIPSAYEEAFAFLYSDLDDRRELSKAEGKPPSGSPTRIETSYFDFARVGRMAVWEQGMDFRKEFELKENALLKKGAVVLQVWLRLSVPWIDDAVDILREKRYFLGGLLPRWFDQDALLMQKIMKRPDWEGMQIHFDRAQRIRDLVQADWARTCSPE